MVRTFFWIYCVCNSYTFYEQTYFWSNEFILACFMPLISFYTPFPDFLMFSGGIEGDQWPEMGWYKLGLILLQMLFGKSIIIWDKKFTNSPRKFFKGCLPQNLLGLFLNTWSHLSVHCKILSNLSIALVNLIII